MIAGRPAGRRAHRPGAGGGRSSSSTSGERLLDTGTPYLGRDAIAALPAGERLLGYTPYQPGMAMFGLPRAVAGDAWWTDARIWFAVVTVAALARPAWLLRDRRARTRRWSGPCRSRPCCRSAR